MEDARKPKHETREAWLLAAVEMFRPKFDAAGAPLPDEVRVSVGWPKGSAQAIGQCWFENASADKLHHIFISPALHEPASKCGVLATLLHELAHAALPMKTGHKAKFGKLCTALGLLKPWKSTKAGPELLPELEGMARVLGRYNHGALVYLGRLKGQKNRHLKIECPNGCGYHLRGSAAMLDTAVPDCPVCDDGTEMVLESELEDTMKPRD